MNIISTGHEDQGYDCYNAYETTHSDNISISGFENDGTVLDFYSENPMVSILIIIITVKDNEIIQMKISAIIEHIIPQSVYNKAYPMSLMYM